MDRIRIAHLARLTATMQNTPPLVTSNKAPQTHRLTLRTAGGGKTARYYEPRAQRLAAPATAFVEGFSVHPLEPAAADLYGLPEGYADANQLAQYQQIFDNPEAGVAPQ